MKRIDTDHGKVCIDGIYSNEVNARMMANQCGLWIVRGDASDDKVEFWTVKPRDAARLEKSGYEIV